MQVTKQLLSITDSSVRYFTAQFGMPVRSFDVPVRLRPLHFPIHTIRFPGKRMPVFLSFSLYGAHSAFSVPLKNRASSLQLPGTASALDKCVPGPGKARFPGPLSGRTKLRFFIVAYPDSCRTKKPTPIHPRESHFRNNVTPTTVLPTTRSYRHNIIPAKA